VNGVEVNILLTKAALRDPRMKRVDAVEQADMAEEWATDLADVTLVDAIGAMRAHYRTSRDPIMLADILSRVGWVEPSPYENITARVAAEQKRRALEAAGVTEAEFDAHQHDAAWIRAHFPDALPAPDQMRDIQQ
jgi:hypothetical protein